MCNDTIYNSIKLLNDTFFNDILDNLMIINNARKHKIVKRKIRFKKKIKYQYLISRNKAADLFFEIFPAKALLYSLKFILKNKNETK